MARPLALSAALEVGTPCRSAFGESPKRLLGACWNPTLFPAPKGFRAAAEGFLEVAAPQEGARSFSLHSPCALKHGPQALTQAAAVGIQCHLGRTPRPLAAVLKSAPHGASNLSPPGWGCRVENQAGAGDRRGDWESVAGTAGGHLGNPLARHGRDSGAYSSWEVQGVLVLGSLRRSLGMQTPCLQGRGLPGACCATMQVAQT